MVKKSQTKLSTEVAQKISQQDSKKVKKGNTFVLDLVTGLEEEDDDNLDLDYEGNGELESNESSEGEEEGESTQEGRGRGRPRKDGLPNKSTKTAKNTNNKQTKRLKTPSINAAEMAKTNFQLFERAMESRINNQARLLNEKLNDSQTENKTFHSHLLKAIQNLTTTVSHFVGRQTNNTSAAFKKEVKDNVKKLPSESASSSADFIIDISSSPHLSPVIQDSVYVKREPFQAQTNFYNNSIIDRQQPMPSSQFQAYVGQQPMPISQFQAFVGQQPMPTGQQQAQAFVGQQPMPTGQQQAQAFVGQQPMTTSQLEQFGDRNMFNYDYADAFRTEPFLPFLNQPRKLDQNKLHEFAAGKTSMTKLALLCFEYAFEDEIKQGLFSDGSYNVYGRSMKGSNDFKIPLEISRVRQLEEYIHDKTPHGDSKSVTWTNCVDAIHKKISSLKRTNV